MKAKVINIMTFNIDCPHCEHGSLINNRNSSYDFEPSDLRYGEVYYCGDCAQSSKVANHIVKQVTGH